MHCWWIFNGVWGDASSVIIVLCIVIGGRGGVSLGFGGRGGLTELSLSGWRPSFSEVDVVQSWVRVVLSGCCHSWDASLSSLVRMWARSSIIWSHCSSVWSGGNRCGRRIFVACGYGIDCWLHGKLVCWI